MVDPNLPYINCITIYCLNDHLSQYTIRFMAIYIPHRCSKCFESVTLIRPQHKGGAFKGPAKGQCLNCMDEQEYDLTIPANKGEVLKRIISAKTCGEVVAQPLRPFD